MPHDRDTRPTGASRGGAVRSVPDAGAGLGALTARALSDGFQAAWPLAVGVVIVDALWPLVAILGVSRVVSSFDGVLVVLRHVASAVFLVMGIVLIRHAHATITADSWLTRPGMWAGFLAGLAAILFYMGVLPGFSISAVSRRRTSRPSSPSRWPCRWPETLSLPCSSTGRGGSRPRPRRCGGRTLWRGSC